MLHSVLDFRWTWQHGSSNNKTRGAAYLRVDTKERIWNAMGAQTANGRGVIFLWATWRQLQQQQIRKNKSEKNIIRLHMPNTHQLLPT